MYGKQIKSMRLFHNLTQVQLSKATKLPQSTISWIENDEGEPNLHHIITLADFYGITIDELIGRDLIKQSHLY